MITQACLLHEPKRSKPWVVRWYGEPDWSTGTQKRYGRSFRHSREAKAFLAEKQAGLDGGAPRDPPQNVTLGRLIAEFEEARLAPLSFSSQQAYRNQHSLGNDIAQYLIGTTGDTHGGGGEVGQLETGVTLHQ